MNIDNPILTGFNPDPSICVVGDDFYIATSTFEWFPGVQIHHSKDLKNWRLLRRPLERVSQLDLRACQSSGGVWAPCLTHDGEWFHLVCAHVLSHGGWVTDSPVSLYTSKSIEGEWSDPISLGANGFDPSIFHDRDGRKYLVNMEQAGLGSGQRFNGITLQEYSPKKKELMGERRHIFMGSDLGFTEGPHIYQKDGYYYLVCAEGGTDVNHAVTVARAKDIWGPYELDPQNPMLSSADQPKLSLQASGHGDFFQLPNGDWYLVHLCKRFLEGRDTDLLGRETALQKVSWPEGEFPRLAAGGHSPQDSIEVEGLTERTWDEDENTGILNGQLNKHLQFLREPADASWLNFERRPGWLSMKGRSSLYSHFNQSLVVRRIQHFEAEVETCVDFKPYHHKQEAGLVMYANEKNHISLVLGSDMVGERGLFINICEDASGFINKPRYAQLAALPAEGSVLLRMRNEHETLCVSWSLDGKTWTTAEERYSNLAMAKANGFTGTFFGIYAQDSTGDGSWADFKTFDYRHV